MTGHSRSQGHIFQKTIKKKKNSKMKSPWNKATRGEKAGPTLKTKPFAKFTEAKRKGEAVPVHRGGSCAQSHTERT